MVVTLLIMQLDDSRPRCFQVMAYITQADHLLVSHDPKEAWRQCYYVTMITSQNYLIFQIYANEYLIVVQPLLSSASFN
jgi:hypothetical protein